MPDWAVTLFVKIVLPLILTELVKDKVLDKTTAAGIQTYEDFALFIRNLKSDHDLKDFPDPPPETGATVNFTVGAKQPD